MAVRTAMGTGMADETVLPYCHVAVGGLGVHGNTATWTQIHDDWPESCAPYADICINVRDKSLAQTKYLESEFDTNGAHPKDHTGSDESYTLEVLRGVFPVLLRAVGSKRWVLHGASGGCVVAVTLARWLLLEKHTVVGVIADCGVPGTGPPLPEDVPCSVFKYTHDGWWPGERRPYDVWIRQGYAVDFEGYTNKGHAWAVDGCCMEWMLKHIARKHAVKILYPAVVISFVRFSSARNMRADHMRRADMRRMCGVWTSGVNNPMQKMHRFHRNSNTVGSSRYSSGRTRHMPPYVLCARTTNEPRS